MHEPCYTAACVRLHHHVTHCSHLVLYGRAARWARSTSGAVTASQVQALSESNNGDTMSKLSGRGRQTVRDIKLELPHALAE